MSHAHLILTILVFIAILIPAGKILQRTGFSPWWSILLIIPLLGIVSLWVFAFSEWPNLPDRMKPVS
jgi:hypothetical protein